MGIQESDEQLEALWEMVALLQAQVRELQEKLGLLQ